MVWVLSPWVSQQVVFHRKSSQLVQGSGAGSHVSRMEPSSHLRLECWLREGVVP